MRQDNEYQNGTWPDEQHNPYWPEMPVPPQPGNRPRQRPHPLTLVTVAVLAAALGIAVALIFANGVFAPSSSSAAPGNSAAPAAGGSSAPSNGGAGALPPLPAGGGKLLLMLNGKVTAISGTSITISGNGPSVTASITSSTHVTGNVSTVSGIKVGDQITAQVSGSGPGHLTATTIQDPGQVP